MQGPLVPFPDRAPLLQEPDHITPERLRWRPVPVPAGAAVDFVQGLITVAGHGDPAERSGLAIHLYCANASMQDTCFSSSDGELLIVPQRGTLLIRTELGQLLAGPREIAVIPRGVKFAVFITDRNGRLDAGGARGYVLEVYAGCFELPERGIIGANGLAEARDFRYPTAAYEERDVPFLSIVKFQGALFKSTAYSSPFDVVAWHGNYAPYVYDLRRFCPVNSVRLGHMDPSIFTVLTVPSTVPGVAIADFVLFPPRWATQEDTMRLPYFHRNCMTEYMGIIAGRYEAKGGGFLPGAGSLHSVMAPHGPDATTFNKFSEQAAEAGPERMSDENLAFMFETSRMLKVSNWAMSTEFRDREYRACWDALRIDFDSSRR